VVVIAGETEMLPLGAPAVENPVPVQLVAFVLFQRSVLEWPRAMLPGVAVRDAVGAAPTVTVALAGVLVAPPAAVQVTE